MRAPIASVKKMLPAVTAVLLLISGTQSGVTGEKMLLLSAQGESEERLTLLKSSLNANKVAYTDFSESHRISPVLPKAWEPLLRHDRRTTRDIRRLKSIEQAFTSSLAVMTGFRLRGHTFGHPVKSFAYRYQLKEQGSRRIIREGFLAAAKRKDFLLLRADFPPVFNQGSKGWVLSIFSAFPVAPFPLYLSLGEKEKNNAGSLQVNGRNQNGSLLYTLHGIAHIRVVKKGSLAGEDGITEGYRYVLFFHSGKLILYDKKVGKTAYSTRCWLKGITPPVAMDEAAARLKRFLVGKKSPMVTIDTVTSGQDTITAGWTSSQNFSSYRVFRSSRLSGEYSLVATRSETFFRDSKSKRGKKYWYRVQGIKKGSTSELSMPVDGYAAPAPAAGKDLYAMLGKKKAPAEKYFSPGEEKTAREHKIFLKPHYLSSLKMTIALFLARGYLKDGGIFVLHDFPRYSLDRERQIFYAIYDKKFYVSFYSYTFFKFLGEGTSSTGLQKSFIIKEKSDLSAYLPRGFSRPGRWGIYNTENTAALSLPVRSQGKKLRLNLWLTPYLKRRKGIFFRTCRVSVNGFLCGEIFSDRGGWYSVLIPEKVTKGKRITINFDFSNPFYKKNASRAFLFRKISLAEFRDSPDLEARMIQNSVFFTMPAGETEYMDDSEEVYIIPRYRAAGIATEYSRDFRGWRSQTLIFGTSNSRLRKEIRKASGKK